MSAFFILVVMVEMSQSFESACCPSRTKLMCIISNGDSVCNVGPIERVKIPLHVMLE